jgi:hypothetical protein
MPIDFIGELTCRPIAPLRIMRQRFEQQPLKLQRQIVPEMPRAAHVFAGHAVQHLCAQTAHIMRRMSR